MFVYILYVISGVEISSKGGHTLITYEEIAIVTLHLGD